MLQNADYPNQLQDNHQEIIAHMSPAEIMQLAQLQGGEYKDRNRGNIHSFLPLGELIAHRVLQPKIQEMQRQNFAHGGSVEGLNKFIRESGRYGDTEAVVLPKVMADLFDSALNGGKPSINPKTGKREYFLGGLLSSLGNIISPFTSAIGGLIKPLASTVAPMLGNLAQSGINAIGGQFGDTGKSLAGALSPGIGNMITNMASNFGNSGQDAEGGQSPSFMDSLRQGVGGAISNAAPQLGMMAGEKLGGLADKLSPGSGSKVGNISSGLISSLGDYAGKNLAAGTAPTASGVAQNAASSLGNSIGGNINHPVASGISNALSSYGQGNSISDSMISGAHSGIDQMQNPLAQYAARGAVNSGANYLGGQTPGQAISSGYSSVSPEETAGAGRYASGSISKLMDSLYPAAETAAMIA